MGKSYFFINVSLKQIIHTEPYNITASLQEAFIRHGWAITDKIDLVDDEMVFVKDMVEKEGYKIDYVAW
jgi:hypothetical protein